MAITELGVGGGDIGVVVGRPEHCRAALRAKTWVGEQADQTRRQR